MKAKAIMLIAGEASGDALAAGLVRALAEAPPQLPTIFFGAGGPRMAEAGVELAVDMMPHSVIGVDAIKNYLIFRKIFLQLLVLAIEREPDVIVLVDFGHFNQRFARAVKDVVRARKGTSGNWCPKIVKYVSPQVWASRPGRAKKLARDIDLLLCLFPFEKGWYAERVPELRVEFVGHPMLEKMTDVGGSSLRSGATADEQMTKESEGAPVVLLLPGSRIGELKRHLPVMIETVKLISAAKKVRFKMILPDEKLRPLTEESCTGVPNLEIQIGGLTEALAHATIAISKTGTITLECACAGVPTLALYKASWLTYQIGKRIVRVKFLAMPNLLAGEAIFPEFIQNDATAAGLTQAALELLKHPQRREEIKVKLQKVIRTLGGPGASKRAAEAVRKLMIGI